MHLTLDIGYAHFRRHIRLASVISNQCTGLGTAVNMKNSEDSLAKLYTNSHVKFTHLAFSHSDPLQDGYSSYSFIINCR